MKKNLYIKTYGCHMNIYDTERMIDILSPLGFDVIAQAESADFIIFNTCHIREKAAEKLYSDLGRVKPIKEEGIKNNKHILIAVAGCTAQAEGAEILRRAPYVDMIFGPQSYQNLPEMLARATRQQDKQVKKSLRGIGLLDVDFPEQPKFDKLPHINQNNNASVFLAIQEGCDKFCHFCVVPYTRGAEYSRPVKDVLVDAKQFIKLGAKEITLLGQNVNAYHGQSPHNSGDEWSLGALIKELANLDGLVSIRYTTSHPRDVNEELISAHRDVEKLSKYLHLPVQSGSNNMLKAMNRKHDRDFYLRIIDQFRNVQPEMVFSSDFIVGFPGETDQDHMDTIDIIKQVQYAQAYSFKYSKRPGTPAWAADNQVDEKIKDVRLQELQALINQQQLEFNQSCIGKNMHILLEKPGRKENQLVGRTPYMQAIHVMASSKLLGQTAPITVTDCTTNSLTGDITAAIC